MAKYGSASFTLLTLDGTNLLGAKVKEFAWTPEVLQEDTTGLGDSWTEQTPTGIRSVTITQAGQYFDTALNGMHEKLSAMPLPARTLVWSPDGVTLFAAKGTLTTAYEVLASNGALTKANVAYTISGSLDVNGEVIQGPADQTASWIGPTIDHGAATAAGGSANQVVSVVSVGITGFVGKLRHSGDGTTFTDLAVFANVTAAPNSQTVPIAGVIQRHVQFVGTITGTGTVRVAAGLFRT